MSYYTFCDRVGHRIFLRYIDGEGKRRQRVFKEYPFELFIKGNSKDAVSLYNEPLSRVKFSDCSEVNAFVKQYSDVTPIFGQTSLAHQFIAKEYPGKIDFDMSKFVVLNFDIEVRHDNGFPKPEFANDEILSISMKVFGKPQRITLGLKEYNPKNENDIYVHCHNEQELLSRFLGFWKRINPDIITGWNIDGFDIPYLVNRISKVMGPEMAIQLSPFHQETGKVFQETTIGRGDKSYRILGITSYDYLNLYKKFSLKKLESYRLDFVAETEVNANKTDLSPWGDNLMRLYNEDFDTFVVYNERDVELVEKLDDKLKFVQLAITITLMTHSRYHEALATVKPWDNMIYNMLLERGVQIPPEEFGRGTEGISGAYVKEPIPGKYNWVVSMDLTSLYPSIIRMYNMSPETLVQPAAEKPLEYLNKMLSMDVDFSERYAEGLVTAANGSVYRQDEEGILAHAMTQVFEERKRVKRQMLDVQKELETLKSNGELDSVKAKEDLIAQLDAFQQALKVVANGGYGAIANSAFRYFNTSIAEGITLTGQLTIRYISNRINEFLNKKFNTEDVDYVVTCDTDSAYICLDSFVTDVLKVDKEKQRSMTSKIIDCLDMFVKKEIEPMLAVEYDRLAEYVGSKNNKMDMKREAIADVGIFRGKKNYILQVWDNEGVRFSSPILKTVGIETARSSTPKIVRDELKNCLSVLLNESNEELLKGVDKFRKRFYTDHLSKVASPRGVSEIDKWRDDTLLYKKGTPIHVKAALHYNDLVMRMGLDAKYPLIREGEKIKFIYLKEPNPIHCTAIGFLDELPPEFGLNKYVDVETQFEKTFLSPLKSFTDLIGWHVVKTSSLDDLWE